MLTELWVFLQGDANRTVLTFVGTGIAAFVGAIWAAFKFINSKRAPAPTMTATHGSVIVGGDMKHSEINMSIRRGGKDG
jgi:hypothetical protein